MKVVPIYYMTHQQWLGVYHTIAGKSKLTHNGNVSYIFIYIYIYRYICGKPKNKPSHSPIIWSHSNNTSTVARPFHCSLNAWRGRATSRFLKYRHPQFSSILEGLSMICLPFFWKPPFMEILIWLMMVNNGNIWLVG